jgi:hypothetical protein
MNVQYMYTQTKTFTPSSRGCYCRFFIMAAILLSGRLFQRIEKTLSQGERWFIAQHLFGLVNLHGELNGIVVQEGVGDQAQVAWIRKVQHISVIVARINTNVKGNLKNQIPPPTNLFRRFTNDKLVIFS